MRTCLVPFAPCIVIGACLSTLPLRVSADVATWIGGTGNWTDATKWDTGVAPATPAEGEDPVDVVIDGDANTESAVTLASDDSLTVTVGNVCIDAEDSLTITKASIKSTGKTVQLNGLRLETSGTLSIGNTEPRNDNRAYATFSQPSSVATGAVVSITGRGSTYKGCYSVLTVPVDGSENHGSITIRRPLGSTNVSGLTLAGFGRFVNNGVISLIATGAGSSSSARLFFSYTASPGACSCIDGTGEIILDKEATTEVADNVRIAGDKYNDVNISTHTITNGPQHTIRGTGYIGGCALANAGLVRAEGTNGVLKIENTSRTYGGKPILNLVSGRMVAMDGTGFLIGATGTANAQFVNSGLLEARAGAVVEFRPCLTTSDNKNTNPLTTALDLSGTLAGGGTFGGKPMRLTADATLSPGDLANTDGTGASTTGTLTFTTNLVLSAGTTLDFQFGRLENSEYDSVVVDGSLTLAGTLRVSQLGSVVPMGTYRIFTCHPGELTGDESSLTLDVAQGLHRPILSVDADAGTVDVTFPPLATVLLLR